MSTIYKTQNIGTLFIPPQQISQYCRQIETDNGLETLLQIEKQEMSLMFVIVQYNADGSERMRSCEWRLDAHTDGIDMLMLTRYHNSWSFIDRNGVELEMSVADNGGDISFWIYDSGKRQLRSHTPQFCQVMSGGQSPMFRQELINLKKLLMDDLIQSVATSHTSYYIPLERLYEAIGQEVKFRKLKTA